MRNNFSKEKILITGATGFVGSNLIKYLLKYKADVYCISAEATSIKGTKSRKIDLADYKKINNFVSQVKPTIVFHLGALVVLSRDFEIAQKCIDSNIKGTLNLLESVKDLKIKRFLFLSTEEVYGNNPLPYNEKQLPQPPSPYAVSKVAGENYCLLYHKIYGLPATVFRINTIYGPYQPPSRFIPTMILKSIKGEAIDFNSGENKRDYLFVDDLIEAIIMTGNKNPKLDGEIINIGSGESISGKELVEKILSITNSSSKINFNAFPDRAGEAKEWRVSIQKAKNILGWESKTILDEGIDSTIKYYQGENNVK